MAKGYAISYGSLFVGGGANTWQCPGATPMSMIKSHSRWYWEWENHVLPGLKYFKTDSDKGYVLLKIF